VGRGEERKSGRLARMMFCDENCSASPAPTFYATFQLPSYHYPATSTPTYKFYLWLYLYLIKKKIIHARTLPPTLACLHACVAVRTATRARRARCCATTVSRLPKKRAQRACVARFAAPLPWRTLRLGALPVVRASASRGQTATQPLLSY